MAEMSTTSDIYNTHKISRKVKKLHRAITNLDKVNILKLLEHNIDIEGIDPYGNTVIHLAFSNYDSEDTTQQKIIEILKIFLDCGVDPNSQNIGGFTVLHLAVVHRMTHVIKFLLDHKVNLHVKDVHGNTLLHYFIKSEYEKFAGFPIETEETEILKLEGAVFLNWLASNGFKLDCTNISGWSPLHLAIQYNLQHIILILLKYNRNMDLETQMNKMLLHRFFQAHTKLKKPCIVYGDFSLFLCNTRYTIDIVKELLARGVSVDVVNEEKDTVLHSGIKYRVSADILELLAEKFTAVHSTDNHGKTTLDLIIDLWWKDSGIDSYVRIVRTLISKGADISRRNSSGLTAVQQAVMKNNIDLLLLLKQNGADMRVRTQRGENLLHLAHADDRTIQFLVQSGVDINGYDNEGITPLHAEICQRYSPKMKLLLKFGANVDLLDNNGFSILHKAIFQRNILMVAELLKYGVDVCDYEILKHFQVIDKDVRDCLLKHIIKMSAARVPGIADCERAVGDVIFGPYREECRREIITLKKCFIDDRTSLFDFLQMDPNRRCSYVNNKNLESILNDPVYGNKFPNYFVLLLGTYLLTVRRKFLLKPAESAWYNLTNIFLPHVCVDRILAHLSNIQLMKMIRRNKQQVKREVQPAEVVGPQKKRSKIMYLS